MGDLAERMRTRLLPAIVTALGVVLLAGGLLSIAAPVTADPLSSPAPTAVALVPSERPRITLPPPSSAGPVASPSIPADRVATRVRIWELGIDLPVLPPGGPDDYPLCDVAQYFRHPSLGQPGMGRATYLYAHARDGMFGPILEASKVQDGNKMRGMVVEVWTSDDQRFLYEITEVRRHVPFDDVWFDDPMAAPEEELWLQTSEGPAVPKGQPPNPKLQVVAMPLSQEPADHADAHPVAKPVDCG